MKRIFHSPWLAQVRRRKLRARDGTTVAYETLGRGPETIVLANGLGGRLYAWEPILDRFAARYRIVTWDYRGLFDSRTAGSLRLSIRDHAEDLEAILDAERIRKAVLVGWSMGVQVILEFAHLFPARADRLVLINGTYGQVFSTSFQPIVHLAGLEWALHELIEYFKGHPKGRQWLISLLGNRRGVEWVGSALATLRKNPRIPDALRQYTHDVLGPDFKNFLHLFQELDSHSAYHHLPDLALPTLLISGGLDVLTPALQSRVMARRLPRAEHFHFPWGTHFVLLEYPREVSDRIERFLDAPRKG